MWQARASHSRYTGLALLAVCGAFLAIAFLTAYVAFEMMAIASFIVGIFLIAFDLEPRIKLLTSAEGLLGPLVALADNLEARGYDGKAIYVPGKEGTSMRVPSSQGLLEPFGMTPVGRGLAASIERELGAMRETEFSYVKEWVPRALESGLDVVERARIEARDGTVEATFEKPYVRPLCVKEDFNDRVCSRIGCPLVSSVGEILASSSGKEVHYLGCKYDRSAQIARASYRMNNGQ
ncbi:MAG: hypothetical protein OK452_07115 [Thaumarchaeota archaeon]|nr:hypothetical protein [Nitrososphaerota archaeon]